MAGISQSDAKLVQERRLLHVVGAGLAVSERTTMNSFNRRSIQSQSRRREVPEKDMLKSTASEQCSPRT